MKYENKEINVSESHIYKKAADVKLLEAVQRILITKNSHSFYWFQKINI